MAENTSQTDNNIEKIGNLIRSEHRFTIHAIAESEGIDKECVTSTFTMYKVHIHIVYRKIKIRFYLPFTMYIVINVKFGTFNIFTLI